MLEQRGLDWTLERLRRAVILLRKSPPGPPGGCLSPASICLTLREIAAWLESMHKRTPRERSNSSR